MDVFQFQLFQLFATSFGFSLTNKKMVWYFQKSFYKGLHFTKIALYIHHIWKASIIVKSSVDVEQKPGPKPILLRQFFY